MKAAVYHGRRDVRIEEIETPGSPAPDHVLLDIACAGICGTDASEWAHGPFFAPLGEPHPFSGHAGPMVLGHEFVGRVAEVGAEVEGVAVGDLVASGAGVWCGACRWCLEGRTNLCERYYTLGLSTHGGLAEQTIVPAKTCRAVPGGMAPATAALAQPVAVALHAVRRSKVAPGDQLAIFGVGGIGALLVAAAGFFGVERIIAIDINGDRLDAAVRLGATEAIRADENDPVSAIRDLTGGIGADVVIEASGVPSAPGAAVSAARRGGSVLLVGLQATPTELDLHPMTVREVDIRTTNAHVCDEDLPDALELLGSSDLAAIVTEKVISLDDLVSEGLERLAAATAGGKILIDLEL